VLLQIDNANLSTSLANEQLNLERAENDLVKKEAEQNALIKELELELASRRLEADKTAITAEIGRDIISLRDWQDNQFNHQKAGKELARVTSRLALTRKAAAEDVALARLTREQIQTRLRAISDDLAGLRITASASGTVLYENAPLTWNSGDIPRKFRVGDQVSPGMVIMTVPDLTEMEARVQISEVDGGLVRRGLAARITADAAPGREFSGMLDFVPEVAERQRRMSNVRVFVATVKLDRTDPAVMRPGMSVRVDLVLDEQQGLVVPREAIYEDAGRFFVRHATHGPTEVTVGARNAVASLVQGLREGDVVDIPTRRAGAGD
jgi:multidrug resistance efflux pump